MKPLNTPGVRAGIFWLFLIATLAGLLFFCQGWVMSSMEKTFLWQQQLYWAMTGWYMWAAIFPFLYLFSRRFPLEHGTLRKNIPVHLLSALIISFLHAYTQVKLNNWFPYVQVKASQMSIFNGYMVGMVMWRMVVYSALVCVSFALDYYRKYREGQMLASRIEARILRAQMEALKMQMDPDFLFDTLHSITDLMHRDLSAADKMIARLGDFLRLTLDSSGTSQVSLRKELEFLRCYLEIQKIRLNQPLSTDFDIEPGTLDARIPNLLLYSLVEEAVERREGAGVADAILKIRTQQVDQTFKLEVHDMHPAGGIAPRPGRNLHERMQQIYGTGFQLFTETMRDGSRRTIVEVPWTDTEDDEQPELVWAESGGPADERGSELEWARRFEAAAVPAQPESRRWWRPYLVASAAFTLLGLFFLAREVLTQWINKEPVEWVNQVKWFVTWYLWALAAPYIVDFSRKFPLVRPQVLRNVLFHLANTLFILAILSTFGIAYSWYLDPKAGPFFAFFIDKFRFSDFSVDVILYWTIVAVGYGVSYYREFRQGEFRSARLRAQLARAQLQALKMQLHPHFLFNTLNSISELMQEEIETAEKMMSHLERFLRLTIQNSEAQEVRFETELEFLKCYLEIEHVRFQDRLSVRMDIEPQAMSVQVPNLLLQPIVENAIRHGIAPLSSAGHIDIRAFRSDGRLQVSVQDNGPGILEDPAANRKGLGLSNTRERLQQLYGKRYRFEMANAPGGGLIVTLEIPWETQA